MNCIDKRKMLEGILYGFSTTKELTEVQMDTLIHVRDVMRKAGLIAAADEYGRIIIRNSDQQQVALGLLI